MKFLNEETGKEWDKGSALNQDPYGSCVYRYAKEWAELMEEKIEVGEKLEDIADSTSHEVDRRPDMGITGFMYGAAVSMLAHWWIHGEQLRRWHNIKTQIRDEGERANAEGGVLNPAIINIGTGPKE